MLQGCNSLQGIILENKCQQPILICRRVIFRLGEEALKKNRSPTSLIQLYISNSVSQQSWAMVIGKLGSSASVNAHINVEIHLFLNRQTIHCPNVFTSRKESSALDSTAAHRICGVIGHCVDSRSLVKETSACVNVTEGPCLPATHQTTAVVPYEQVTGTQQTTHLKSIGSLTRPDLTYWHAKCLPRSCMSCLHAGFCVQLGDMVGRFCIYFFHSFVWSNSGSLWFKRFISLLGNERIGYNSFGRW